MFNADGCVMTRDADGNWSEERIGVDTVADMVKVFEPYEQKDVTEIKLDKYRRIYYCMSFLTDGIHANAVDDTGEKHYLVSPLLLVNCNDEHPVKLTDETLLSIKDSIVFF